MSNLVSRNQTTAIEKVKESNGSVFRLSRCREETLLSWDVQAVQIWPIQPLLTF